MAYATLGLCPAPDGPSRPCVKIHDWQGLRHEFASAGWRIDGGDCFKATKDRYDFAGLAGIMREAHALGARWVLYPEATKWRQLISQNLGWCGTDKPSALEAGAMERAAVQYALIYALGVKVDFEHEVLAAFAGLQLSVLPDPAHGANDPDQEPAGPMVVTIRPDILTGPAPEPQP